MENIELIKRLKDLLPCERFILGGSRAISLHGIQVAKQPSDIDLIIEKPKYGCSEMLDELQRKSPNLNLTGTASMAYSFYFEGVKCDVWIKNELSEYPLLSYEGILVNQIRDIVDWKMRFKRSKDWVQLMQWARSIFDKKKFEDQLMEVGTESDGNTSFAGDVNDKVPQKKHTPYDPLDDLPF